MSNWVVWVWSDVVSLARILVHDFRTNWAGLVNQTTEILSHWNLRLWGYRTQTRRIEAEESYL